MKTIELCSCPKCGSPDPERHPAVQHEGEVQPCDHPFHLRKRAIIQNLDLLEDMPYSAEGLKWIIHEDPDGDGYVVGWEHKGNSSEEFIPDDKLVAKILWLRAHFDRCRELLYECIDERNQLQQKLDKAEQTVIDERTQRRAAQRSLREIKKDILPEFLKDHPGSYRALNGLEQALEPVQGFT